MADAASIATAAAALFATLVEMVKNGASDEDIRERLAEPAGVAQDLLDAIRGRATKFQFPG